MKVATLFGVSSSLLDDRYQKQLLKSLIENLPEVSKTFGDGTEKLFDRETAFKILRPDEAISVTQERAAEFKQKMQVMLDYYETVELDGRIEVHPVFTMDDIDVEGKKVYQYK